MKNSIWRGLGVVGGLTVMAACGAVRSPQELEEEKRVQTQKENQAVFDLGERVVKDSAIQFVPEDQTKTPQVRELATPARFEKEPAKNTYSLSENQLHFSEILQMHPSSNGEVPPVYLAWKAMTGDGKIVMAHYEYRRMDYLNRVVGTRKLAPVHFDQENEVWFVPLAEAMGDYASTGPHDLQRLVVYLELDGGKRVSLNVVFRVSGLLPDLKPLVLESSSSMAPMEVSGQAEYIVWKDVVQNPTGRPLTLWLRTAGQFVLKTGIHTRRPQFPWDAPPTYVDVFSIANAPLELGEIRVESSGRAPLKFEPMDTSVHGIRLDPGQKVAISWVAQPVQTQKCDLPGAVSGHHQWSRLSPKGGGGENRTDAYIAMYTPWTQSWSLTGGALSGILERRFALADEFATEAEINQAMRVAGDQARVESRFRVFVSEKHAVGLAAGTVNWNGSVWSCQGLF